MWVLSGFVPLEPGCWWLCPDMSRKPCRALVGDQRGVNVKWSQSLFPLSIAQHLFFYVVLLFTFPLAKGCFRIAKAEDSLGGKTNQAEFWKEKWCKLLSHLQQKQWSHFPSCLLCSGTTCPCVP